MNLEHFEQDCPFDRQKIEQRCPNYFARDLLETTFCCCDNSINREPEQSCPVLKIPLINRLKHAKKCAIHFCSEKKNGLYLKILD